MLCWGRVPRLSCFVLRGSGPCAVVLPVCLLGEEGVSWGRAMCSPDLWVVGVGEKNCLLLKSFIQKVLCTSVYFGRIRKSNFEVICVFIFKYVKDGSDKTVTEYCFFSLLVA